MPKHRDEPFEVKLTPAAQEAMAQAIAKHPAPAVVRLGVLPGIHPTAQMFISKPRPDDEVLEFGGARVVVDPASRIFLNGATVDFHPTSIAGGFSIEGPNFTSHPTPPSPSTAAPSGGTGTQTQKEEALREILRKIYDPEIPLNIVDLGLIYGIEWPEEDRVDIRMTLTSPGCPVAEILHDQVKTAAETVPGIREASVTIVWDPPWGPDRMSDLGKRQFGYA